jgi:hypothetical protein
MGTPGLADAVGGRLQQLFPAVTAYRPSGRTRHRFWQLPPLAEARQDFEQHLGQPIEWSNMEPDDEESQDEKPLDIGIGPTVHLVQLFF